MKYLLTLCLVGNILFSGNAQFTSPTTFSPDLWLKKEVALEQRNPPKTGLINFNEAYEFNGDGTYLEIPFDVDVVSRFTFISVFHCTDPSLERGVWGAKNSQRAIMLSTQRVSGPKKTITYSGGEVTIPVLNTTVQYWGKSKIGEVPPSIVLGHPGEHKEEVSPFLGYIPEYLVFNRILREEERHKVESYLAIKYGLTLKAADYVNSEGQVIWNKEQNAAYTNRVAAIGRDDFFALHQKQSSSTAEPGVLTIGATRIAATNDANPTELNNLDVLIWGDNDRELELEDPVNRKQAPFTFLSRNWKMQVVGTTAYDLATQVEIDLSNIQIPANYKPWLVIDRSGSGSFSTGKLEYIELSRLSPEGKAVFDQINWDSDRSGSDAFTFAIGPEQLPLVEHFKVYANPSHGNFIIDIALHEKDDISIEVFNVQGQLIRTMEGEDQEVYQFPEHLPADGVYLIRLRTSQGRLSKELVIAN